MVSKPKLFPAGASLEMLSGITLSPGLVLPLSYESLTFPTRAERIVRLNSLLDKHCACSLAVNSTSITSISVNIGALLLRELERKRAEIKISVVRSFFYGYQSVAQRL